MRLCKCGCGEEVIQTYTQGREQLYVDAKHRNRGQQRVRRERLRLAGLPVDPVPADRAAAYNRTANLRRMGLTVAEYDALREEQGGGCAMCGAPPRPGRRLAVDHDHECCPPKRACHKCIRGLLCPDCNRAIGLLRDNPVLLRAAVEYLGRSRPVGAKRNAPISAKRCKRGHAYDIEWVEGGRTVRRCSICRRLLEQARRKDARDKQDQ